MRSLCAIFLFVCLPAIAGAQPWSDNFDSYPTGPIGNQGGWEEWFGGPGTAIVTNTVAMSAPHSLEMTDITDTVHQFSGATSGVWVFTAWMYIGEPWSGHSFILLNRYPVSTNWSLQLAVGSDVYCDGCEEVGNRVPTVHNQWVPLQVTIDLDADRQTVYYNNSLVVDMSWTGGVSGGGDLNIAAVDLYLGLNVFYDDMSLDSVVPVEATSWGRIKAAFK